MRRLMTCLGAATILMTAQQAFAAGAPSPASCPRLPRQAEDISGRKGPFAISRQFTGIARANHDSLAVSTLDGGTHCVDVRNMSTGDDFGLSRDGRFFTFSWFADEAGGFILVDRTGRGQNLDTGVRPLFSPSHLKFAAIEISESGFGSLNGFAVWQVDPAGVRRLTFLDNLPRMADWRLDGWAGEACINISAIPMDKYPENAADLPKVGRTRYLARPGPRGWSVVRGSCPRA